MKKLLPALQAWLVEAEQRQQRGLPVLPPDPLELGRDLAKRRKKRTVFNQEMVSEGWEPKLSFLNLILSV